MKKTLILLFFVTIASWSQVGIGTTTPDNSSLLDITATDKGMLIPRVSLINVTNVVSPINSPAESLLVYNTNSSVIGGNGIGFYYFNGSEWEKVITTSDNNDSDWYVNNTTNSSTSINDDIYTLGNVAIGLDNNSTDANLFINSTTESAGLVLSRYHSNNTAFGNSGISAFTNITTGSTGWYQNIASSLQSSVNVSGTMYNYRAVNNINAGGSGDNHYLFYGLFSNNTGTSSTADRYGSYISFLSNTTSIGGKYGHYSLIPSTLAGTHYGTYADVQSTTGYAGYFIGRFSLGSTTANRYLMPLADGTANQVMQTDGSGNLSWITPTIVNNANNGLNVDTGTVQLGGNLTEDTTITYGTFDTRFNLNSTGDFIIQDNGSGMFRVADNGEATFGDDTYWRDTSILGTILARLFDSADDGVFDVYQGGTIVNRIHGNGDSYFTGGDVGFGLTNPNYQVDISETDNSKTRALNIIKTDNTVTTSYGIYNSKTSSNSSLDYAQYNELAGVGTGIQYSVYNDIQTTGSGAKYGVYNNFSADSPSEKYGIYNNFLSNSGNYYGVSNNMTGGSNGATFGIRNTLSGTGTGSKTGISNNFSGANGDVNIYTGISNSFSDSGNGARTGVSNIMGGIGDGRYYGVNNQLDGSGSGPQYGTRQEISNTGSATHYGSYNSLSGTGTGDKYGAYNIIGSGAGGTHYGTYNNVNVNNGWAGYFLGRNYISGRLSIGELDNPTASLNIRRNSTGTNSHIELEEVGAGDGARIRFRNSVETINEWTLWGLSDNTAADSRFNIHHTTTGNVLIATGSGRVGIRRTPTTNTFEVNGNASKTTAGSWLANSDRRLKKEIKTINGKTALNKITKLRGVTYKWSDDKTGIERPSEIQYGFIAQEIKDVFPTKVSKDNLGYYQTAYGDYDALFVQAIKELDKKTKIFLTKNKLLEAKVKQQEAEITALKQLLSNYKTLEVRLSNLENK